MGRHCGDLGGGRWEEAGEGGDGEMGGSMW